MGRRTLVVLLLRLSGEHAGLSLCFTMTYTSHTCFCVYQLHNKYCLKHGKPGAWQPTSYCHRHEYHQMVRGVRAASGGLGAVS